MGTEEYVTDHKYQGEGARCSYKYPVHGTAAYCHRSPSAHPAVGDISTRALLEEMRLRGDLAMVAMPTSERGADGAALSALASVLLKSSARETLEAKRGE